MHHLPWIILAVTIISSDRAVEAGKKKRQSYTQIVMAAAGKNRFTDSTQELGKKVFYASCYSCHKDSITTLAPGQFVLSTMTPRAILATLDNGKMRPQAAGLSEN